MDWLEDLRISLLNLNFVMIYVIHKTLVLIKIHLNYLKDNIFECFLKSIIDLKKKERKTKFNSKEWWKILKKKKSLQI